MITLAVKGLFKGIYTFTDIAGACEFLESVAICYPAIYDRRVVTVQADGSCYVIFRFYR